MSQTASFYLVKNGRREEFSHGGCSGAVYLAIWDYCEDELSIDCRINAPQTEDTLDCVRIDGETAAELLRAFQKQNLPKLAAGIATDWELPVEAVQRGLETLLSHLKLARGDTALLYEMA